MNKHNYDPILTAKVVSGLKFGFDLGFRGTVLNDKNVKNLTSAFDHPAIVLEAINKELQAGRFAGPFSVPPFKSFQVSPIGLVPKKTKNKFRMITNLSSPESSSINSGISDTFAKVEYSSIFDAVQLIIAAGPHPFLSKSDIQHAFRLLPISPSQYHLLCMKWQDSFYFDRCLPMGARSSCSLFESFSSAIEFIAHKEGITYLTHYLDDFLFISPSLTAGNNDLTTFKALCQILNVPLSKEKTMGPSQIMEFLGYEFNTIKETILLPKDKVEKGLHLIQTFLQKKRCKLSDLQSLLGFLNFACAVIVPGRAFLQRLYMATANVSKPYYSIRLNQELKKDLLVWQSFFCNHNGVTLYREQLFLSPDVCHIYSDASQSLGHAAIFGKHWFFAQWPSSWWCEQNIVFLELLPIVLALEVWGCMLANQVIIFHTDNEALVSILNKQRAKEPLVMLLVRSFVLNQLRHNVYIKAVHVPGFLNIHADALSRLQVQRFRDLNPEANPCPTQLPRLPDSLITSKELWAWPKVPSPTPPKGPTLLR